MDVCEDIGAGVDEDLGAAFEPQSVLREREFPALQHGAHGAIGNDDPVVHGIEELL